jgi:hypothetical protein
MAIHEVGIARRDSTVEGWVFGLPGCRAVGGSVDEVMALLPVVIGEHLAWLDAHGESRFDSSSIQFRVVEELEAVGLVTFQADRQALTVEEAEAAARHLGFAHQDYAALVRHLPDSVLDWRPEPSSVRIDAVFAGVRSIRDMMPHVAAATDFYFRGLGVATRIPILGSPDFATCGDTARARLRGLTPEERSGPFTVMTARGESEWTARQAARRLIHHHRFHAKETQQRLSWLTLGVPEVMPASRE